MGWCEVKCSCSNRIPLPKAYQSDPLYSQPVHLTAKQLKERNIWIEKVQRMYKCGHRDGTLIQLSSCYLLQIGRILNRMLKTDASFSEHFEFEIFLDISDSINYESEYLSLFDRERDLWRLEIEELFDVIEYKIIFPYKAQQVWNLFWNDLFNDPYHQKTAGSIPQILSTGLELCKASEQSGNPIEFYW